METDYYIELVHEMAKNLVEKECREERRLSWQEAITHCFEDCGGTAINQQVFDLISYYRKIPEEDQRITYGVPHFYHRIRYELSNMRRQHKLIPRGRGKNALPPTEAS